MDLLPLFRRCGTGPVVGMVRQIMLSGGADWLIITDPTGGVAITVADMVIIGDDVFGFEDDHDIGRRLATGAGATSPYDWEGMNVALIQRIHDHGRGSYTSVDDLEAAIYDYLAQHNTKPKPFTWTKTAEDILALEQRALDKLDEIRGNR